MHLLKGTPVILFLASDGYWQTENMKLIDPTYRIKSNISDADLMFFEIDEIPDGSIKIHVVELLKSCGTYEFDKWMLFYNPTDSDKIYDQCYYGLVQKVLIQK